MKPPIRAGTLDAVVPPRLGEAAAAVRRALAGEVGPAAAERAEPSSLVDSMFSGLHGMLDGLRSFDPFAPASPLPVVAAGGSFDTLTHAGPAGSRDYKLYVPSRAGPDTPLPLVVMLHGCTQSPDDFAAGTRMNAWAERDNFLACYPAQSRSANGQRCWNWFRDADQRRGAGEPAIVAGIVRDVMARHAVDPDRVYVAGLSAGGALAATLGQRYPDLFAAVGVHSGLPCGAARDVNSAVAAMRGGGALAEVVAGATPVPTIVFHGDRDATVDAANAEAVTRQALGGEAVDAVTEDGAAANGRGYRRTRHVDRAGHTVVERWTVAGSGHAWSGGSPDASFTDPQGPDASGEMLRFFAEHVGPASAAAR